MGVIIGGKLVKNGRTDERTTANERSVCCALPKNYSFDRIYIYLRNKAMFINGAKNDLISIFCLSEISIAVDNHNVVLSQSRSRLGNQYKNNLSRHQLGFFPK